MIGKDDLRAPANIADLAVVSEALKLLCRENGVDTDRRRVLHVATLLMGLCRDGVRDQYHLIGMARERLAEVSFDDLASSEA